MKAHGARNEGRDDSKKNSHLRYVDDNLHKNCLKETK